MTAGSLIKQVDGGYYCPNPICDSKIANSFELSVCGDCPNSNYFKAVCKVDLSKIRATLLKIDGSKFMLTSARSNGRRTSVRSSRYGGTSSVKIDDNMSVGGSSVNQSQGGQCTNQGGLNFQNAQQVNSYSRSS